MADFPTWMPVVALALRDRAGRILLQQRLPGKPHAGAWEFPGGKVEQGETPPEALVREIAEELALHLAPEDLCPGPFTQSASGQSASGQSASGQSDGPVPIVLFLYTCSAPVGEPAGMEGQAWGWFTREQAACLPLAPMDQDLLDRLGQ